jgi:uncharacterized membrane protein
MLAEDRIAALERRVAKLEATRPLDRDRRAPEAPPVAWTPPPGRPGALPRRAATVDAAPAPRDVTPRHASPAPRDPSSRAGDAAPRDVTPRPASPAVGDLEDFVGGRLLAWLGGVAVLAGLAFLLTIAISSGWIGEGARTALAGVLSAGLLGVGVWLRERKGRTEASLAAAAVGVAGLFGTLGVAGPVYDLVPIPVAYVGAFATGACATVLAIRWRAQAIGWLGLLGALLAPAVLGGGIVFLAIAFAAAIPVLVHERWTALGVLAYLLTTVQWAFAGASAAALVVFGALTVLLALGLEINRRGLAPVAIGPRARTFIHPIAVSLVGLNALVLAATGWNVLDDGEPWLVGLAAVHVALGIALTRVPRVSRELALVVISIGVVLADIAFGSIAGGLPLVLGWAVSAIPFAAVLGARSGGATRVSTLVDRVLGPADDEQARRADRVLALAGLFGQITLSAFQSLAYSAPVDALNGPLGDGQMLVAAGSIAVAAWACGRLASAQLRPWLDALALTAVAHFTGLALEGAALAAALSAQALGLAALAQRHQDPYAAWGSLAFAGLALAHALTTLATPDALLDGLDAPLAAAGALAAVAAALYGAGRAPLAVEDARRWLETAAGITLLYLAGVELVTLAGPDHAGQTLLSALWALAGVGALVRGLLTDDRELRRGALVLLGVTVGKVFLYDMASLDSLYRVGSLIGLGLLLLCGAFAWQQVRGTYSGTVDRPTP